MEKPVKCVVWDLDETIWEGVLLEDEAVSLRPVILTILEELDQRGILLSVASKNNHEDAMDKLKYFGIDHYFLYPQIHWNAKSSSIQTIAQELNIGLDSIAFVDDQPFERDEVAFALPEVLCIDAAYIGELLNLPQMRPKFNTVDSKNRRLMMKADEQRKAAEWVFQGPKEEFLSSLNMRLFIHSAGEEDLQRVEELTVRTHQLNSTGITFGYEELVQLTSSSTHLMLVSELTDLYGTYGKIGLSLVEQNKDAWTIKLLLMSCRVMSRGVGSVMLQRIIHLAKENGVRLFAEFKATDRNRMMYMTFTFSGFKEVGNIDGITLFEYVLDAPLPLPSYVQVEGPEVMQ